MTLRRNWLEVLVKACMHRLYFSGMLHHGGHKVAECGPVASEIGGVVGLLVYMTPKWLSISFLSDGDCEMLVFKDILERVYNQSGRRVG